MTSIVNYLSESWGKIPRTLYIHKLIKSGDYTNKNIEKLKEIGVFNNIDNIYIYSFIHPDTNLVCSFTGSHMLKPGLDFKMWYAPTTPLRVVIYKGANEGENAAAFSAEKIASDKFNTS